MVKRKLLLDALVPTLLEGLPASISALPIEVEDGRKVFIFAIEGDERKLFGDKQLRAMAQTCGNVVHPAQAVFLVLPEGAKLVVYSIRD